jgi:hypothetical protein
VARAYGGAGGLGMAAVSAAGKAGAELGIEAALVKWPKYFFPLITMKLASLVEIEAVGM